MCQTSPSEIKSAGVDKAYTCDVTVSGEKFTHTVQLLTFGEFVVSDCETFE